MHRYEHRPRALAMGLAMLAGFVDALGFLQLGGLFVSFMSGNSTRLAVGTVAGSPAAPLAAGLILSFIAGVTGGVLAGQAAGRWRKQAVLALVTLLLATAATIASIAGPRPVVVTFVMAAAMGVANDVFLRDGEVSIGVTYMTGALVKLGQNLARTLTGGPLLAWLPHLLLWLSLVGGAAVYPALGLGALWIATAIAALLLAAAFAIGPASPSGSRLVTTAPGSVAAHWRRP